MSAELVVARERSVQILGVGFERAVRFGELLRSEGELRGLIGPRELDRVWVRHVLNSAAVAEFLPSSGSVVDVGSGAGLPGIVLAAMKPHLAFTLVEPMERRVAWLHEVVEELGAENVEVLQAQAQELHGKRTFDAVTARAVAGLDKLLRWTWPLVARRGSLLAMKGARAEEEIRAAAGVLEWAGAALPIVHSVDLLGDGELTRVVEINRS